MKRIVKAKRVFGRNLYLRDITTSDASFVLDLRQDPDKGKYLSETSARIEDQICWIEDYGTKEDQAYFIICDKQDNTIGCVRMYAPIEDSYCWGSWLMISGLSPFMAIESVLLIYAYGKYLGFKDARLDVRQSNEYVWKFHEKFSSASLIRQDDIDKHYIVTEDNINKLLTKYKHLLTTPLAVEGF